MKRIISILAGAVLVGASAAIPDAGAYYVYPEEVMEGVISYISDSYGAAVIHVERDAVGAVVIPDTLGGAPVTEIRDSALMDCTQITSVTIPDSVSYIGNWAFQGCTSLYSVKLPNDLDLGASAFCNCAALTEVTLPERGLVRLRTQTFKGCSSLKSIVIPKCVSRIGDGVFEGCAGLEEIRIENPLCDIHNDPRTICSSLIWHQSGFDGVIVGYPNSTAQKYAEYCTNEKNAPHPFRAIEGALFPCGDVDMNWVVDAADASLVLREYADRSTGAASGFTDEQWIYAEVDLNGVVDAADASAILGYYSYRSTGGVLSDLRTWLTLRDDSLFPLA